MSSKIIIVVLACLCLSACRPKTEKNNLTGKYKNIYELGTIHYVELKKDSTFLHYYKKNDSDRENKGHWRLSVRPQKTEIIFDTWVDFGYKDEPQCNGCLRAVKIEDGELIFNADLPKEMNFKKEE